ncbi:MAG: GNAT family N-acetyltransferase [Pseudomonadota bacterium]
MPALKVRKFVEADAGATAQIYFDAVRFGAAGHYDERQRKAWADRVPDTSQWLARLNAQHTFVAEVNSEPVGFMTVDDAGHIDLAFVAPDRMGTGVADALYAAVEGQALQLGAGRLDTAASHLARSFFERHGWSVVKQQSVAISDVELINFVMEKRLS